jgi:hypothetical protein
MFEYEYERSLVRRSLFSNPIAGAADTLGDMCQTSFFVKLDRSTKKHKKHVLALAVNSSVVFF